MELPTDINKENIQRDYRGKWSFSYRSDYLLDIDAEAGIRLYDTLEEEELGLTLIKYCEFYIELFAEGEEENMCLTLYPISRNACIGIEIRSAERLTKSPLPGKKQPDFHQFVSIGDTFPDWINGTWQGVCTSISFEIEKITPNTLHIAANHQLTGSIDIGSTGYIGHSGILLTLCDDAWIDSRLVCELQFDYSDKSILYIEKMLLPAQPVRTP